MSSDEERPCVSSIIITKIRPKRVAAVRANQAQRTILESCDDDVKTYLANREQMKRKRRGRTTSISPEDKENAMPSGKAVKRKLHDPYDFDDNDEVKKPKRQRATKRVSKKEKERMERVAEREREALTEWEAETKAISEYKLVVERCEHD